MDDDVPSLFSYGFTDRVGSIMVSCGTWVSRIFDPRFTWSILRTCKLYHETLVFTAGWDISTPDTVAASSCWKRANTDTLTRTALAALSSSLWDASVTCSGTHLAATPWPASEGQTRRGRGGLGDRERAARGRRREKISERLHLHHAAGMRGVNAKWMTDGSSWDLCLSNMLKPSRLCISQTSESKRRLFYLASSPLSLLHHDFFFLP